METPLLTIRPDITNALFPSLLKTLVYTLISSVFIFGIFVILRAFNLMNYSNSMALIGIISVIFLILIIPLIIQMIKLYNTRYYFFRTHIVSEFRFISLSRISVPYNQIVQITSEISIWDRLCGAGDIHLHTSEDKAPDVVLSFIKNPEKIEHKIYTITQSKSHKSESKK